MKINELLNKLESYRAGTFVTLGWERDVSSAKAKKLGIQVMKSSSGLIRTEVDYNNLKAVQGMERGDKESWFEHFNKGILQSKKDPSKKYLQAFPVPGKKFNVRMFVNGVEEDAQSLYEKGLITKAALGNTCELDTFTVSVDNIVNFGGCDA